MRTSANSSESSALNRIMRRVVTAAAVTATLSAIGLATAPSASADSVGTPDNYSVRNVSWPWHTGWVMWNDYADADHSHDLDDIWITDRKGDGESIELVVYRGGEEYKTVRASYGETEKVYLWNVRKGEKVYWKTCNPKPGHRVCWGTHYFKE